MLICLRAEPSSKTIVTIEDCLLKLLTDKSHIVRMKAADYVRNLFRSSNNLPSAPSQQQRVFDKVADALSELLVVKVSCLWKPFLCLCVGCIDFGLWQPAF